MVVNGILYVLVTGCRWMDLPAKYGSYKTCWVRFRRWSVMGVWSKVLEAILLKVNRIHKETREQKLSRKARSRYSSTLQSFPDIEGAERSIG
jgi:transposase